MVGRVIRDAPLHKSPRDGVEGRGAAHRDLAPRRLRVAPGRPQHFKTALRVLRRQGGTLAPADHASHEGRRRDQPQQPNRQHDYGDDHFDDGEPAFVLHCRITLPIELITMESLFPAAPVIRTTVTALSRLKPRGTYWTESRVAVMPTLKRSLKFTTAPPASTFTRHRAVTH